MSDIPGLDGADPGDVARWVTSASPDGLWVFDGGGRTVWANERMARLLGRTPEEMRGFSVYDAVDTVGQEQFRDHLADLRRADERGEDVGDDLECSLLDRDGRRFWALVAHSPIVDDDGVRRGWLHRVSEHSRQRHVVDLLAEAQSIAGLGSWEWDASTGRTSWSEQLFRIYGLEPTPVPPPYENFLDLIHPDDRELVHATIQEGLAGGDTWEYDARTVRPGGEIVWVRGRGVVTRDAAGAVVRLGGTTQDITEKKAAEQALGLITAMATAANESATLAEALPAVLGEVATHTTWRPVLAAVVAVDGQVQATIGPPEGVEASDMTHTEALELANRSINAREVRVETSASGSFVAAVPVVAEDRVACVVVLDTRSPLPPAGEDATTIHQVTALFARVAEREWNAERLAQARDEAMQASLAKSEFLATMSHEIRTPLNGVIGLAELLGRTELTQHQRRLSDGIDQAGRVLLDLVNDILDLSKIEAGRLELETVDFDPAAVLERAAGLVAERARAKGLELSVANGPDVPFMVSGDPVRFGQVVANLATNAVKFTDSGRVSVTLRLQEVDESGPLLRVEVSDTGRGITPEVRARLFRSFSQGDSSTTRQYGGTGLGLSISRQIVDAFHGEIGVDSAPGQGSTFWFTARFAPASTRAIGRPESHVAAVSSLRVLVIGRDGTHRQRVEDQLAAWSVRVTSASSGVEGVAAVHRAEQAGEPFDVIICDDPGPGTAGLQLARMLRSDQTYRHGRIVLVTDSAEPLPRDVLRAAGVDASLTSPVMPSALFDAMATVAGAHLVGDARPQRHRVDAPTGSGGSVLVVEDNEVNQLVARGILESLGYTVTLAADGAEAVELHRDRADDFVAVLMDCQMPVMDGYEATQRIREQEAPGVRLPVIAMTAAAIAGERERCLAAGMDDFLTKPIDVTLLASTLQRWTGVPVLRRVPLPAQPAPEPAPEPASASGPAAGAGEAPSSAEGDDAVEGDGVVDLERLAELGGLDPGEQGLLLRFIGRFGDGARQKVLDLRESERAGDPEEMARVAHALKGTAANLGAFRLADTCRRIEQLGTDGVLAGPELVERVAEQVEEATRALEDYGRSMRGA